MTAFRRPVQAMVVMLVAAGSVLSLAAPSLAAPPFPAGAQATALVGGTPLIRVVCPAGSPGAVAGGISTKGGVSVGSPAGARCTPFSAATDGLYAIAGETPPLPGTLRFSASCDSASGATGTAVDVPAGTNVAGIGVVPQQTTITTLNTMVTYPNGTTAIVNEVITTPTSVTRNAIRITSGPNAGTIIGQVVCGSIYPLAVDAPSGAASTPAVATAGTDAGASRSSTVVIAVAALGLLLIAQLAIGRRARRTRG